MREMDGLQLACANIAATAAIAEVDLAPYIHVGNREVKAIGGFINTGADTDETIITKFQESADTVDGNFADITGATFAIFTHDDDTPALQEIHFVVKKRYLRAYSTLAGTTPVFDQVVTVLAIKRSTT